MKVCYIYREKEKKEYSIEAVFDTIASELNNKVQISKWYKPVGWKNTLHQIKSLRRQKFDLYQITGDVYYLWLFLPWKRTVMTVHDIGMYKNNPWSFKRWLFVVIGILIPSLIHKKVICVSQLTKSDLVNILHVPSKKVEVIENPLSIEVVPKHKEFNSECPVIMQIGTGWHKNLDTLIESVKDLSCVIDIVGNPDGELISRMEKYGIKYCISSKISNDEVKQHYENCDMLYFVSRSEGFGLPIIEAQTVGRPVLTSLEEPTNSVSGVDGAILLNPDDIVGIRDAIINICNSEELRSKLISNGFSNVARFAKDKIASKYFNLYKLLLGHA